MTCETTALRSSTTEMKPNSLSQIGTLLFRGLLLLGLLCALVGGAAADGDEQTKLAVFWDEVVCRVDESEINRRQVETEKAKLLPWTSFHGEVSAEDQMTLRRSALQSLIDEELQYQYAKRQKLKVSRKEVKLDYEKLAQQHGGKDALKKRIKNSNASEKKLKAALKRKRLIALAQEHAAASAEPVENDAALQYYEENRATFRLPRQAVVRQILLPVPPLERSDEDWRKAAERGQGLRERFLAGEPIETLVAKVATGEEESGESPAAENQLLGVVHPGQLESPLDAALWSLTEGEMSQPIRAFKGIYLLTVERLVPPRQLTYEEVAERLKKKLAEERGKERVAAWREELRAQAKIEILDPQLAATPDASSGTGTSHAP